MKDREIMYHKKIRILRNMEINPTYYRMALEDEGIAKEAKPGQFIHVRVRDEFDPLLRRPFSIHRINRKEGIIEILFNIVGKGTLLLSEKKEGEYLDVIGPLGRGFLLEEEVREVLLVAGGIGIAPLYALAEELIREGYPSYGIVSFIGAETKSLLIGEEDLKDMGIKVKVATKDGSKGFNGMVSMLLEEYISKGFVTSKAQIFSCGPYPMLKMVFEIANKYNISCQVSLEEKMGCGIGACLGCVVKVREKGSSAEDYQRVCVSGPVFDAYEVVWE